jgi:hypothetical protein
MQMSESVALIRALRVINKSLEHVERILGKVLSRSDNGDEKAVVLKDCSDWVASPARLTVAIYERPFRSGPNAPPYGPRRYVRNFDTLMPESHGTRAAILRW